MADEKGHKVPKTMLARKHLSSIVFKFLDKPRSKTEHPINSARWLAFSTLLQAARMRESASQHWVGNRC